MKFIIDNFLFIAIGILMLISGCSSSQSQGSQAEFVIGVWNGDEKAIIEEVVREYSAISSINMQVEVISVDSYHDRLWSYILSKSPNWDIAFAKSEWIPRWIDYQGLLPIYTPEISDEAGLQDFTMGGELYAWPIMGDIPILWYRTDLLSGANLAPPRTWDELYKAVSILSDPPNRYGLALSNDPLTIGSDYINLFLGFGGEVNNEQNLIDFNSPESASALNFLVRLNQEGLIPPAANEPVDSIKAMQEGRAAMAILWTSQAAVLFDCQQSPVVCPNGNPLIAGTLIPSTDLENPAFFMRRSTALIIPSGSDFPDEAESFIAWLTTPEGNSVWEKAKEGALQENISPTNPALELAAQYYPEGISLDRFQFSDKFYDQMNDTVFQVVTGAAVPEDALRNLAIALREDMYRTDTRP